VQGFSGSTSVHGYRSSTVVHGDRSSNGVQQKSELKVYRCSIGVQE